MAKRKRKIVFNEKLSDINDRVGSPVAINQKAGAMDTCKKRYTRRVKHKGRRDW